LTKDEQTYSSDQLDLMLAAGYVNRLLGNARVVRYLAQHHADILYRVSEAERSAKSRLAAAVRATDEDRPFPGSLRLQRCRAEQL
jgi:hypothetical protein